VAALFDLAAAALAAAANGPPSVASAPRALARVAKLPEPRPLGGFAGESSAPLAAVPERPLASLAGVRFFLAES
jgi:hypothetical protein